MSDSRPAKVGKEFAKENAREASLEQSVIGPELKLEPVPTISFNFYEKSTAEKRGTQEKQQESITEAARERAKRENNKRAVLTPTSRKAQESKTERAKRGNNKQRERAQRENNKPPAAGGP
jgi:hypothetical protein